MDINIRIAAIADIDMIFDIRTSVKENHLSRPQLETMGITYETLGRAISAEPCLWLADVKGIPAAFSMVDMKERCIFALFVRPEFEGRGLGRRLLEHAESRLFEHHRVIWLETDEASRANGFYQKMGRQAVEKRLDGDIRFEKRRPSRSSSLLPQ